MVTLKRSLGPALLAMFGLGNILGAGVYVLIGKVAGEAGYFAPLSFLLAAVVAAFSALAYAELAARYPDAGGEVVYLDRAFGVRALSLAIGAVIAAAGMTSAAAITRGFAGYVQVFLDAPPSFIVAATLLALAAVAVWGVRESLFIAAVFTVVEAAGLLVVIAPAALEPGRWLDVAAAWPGRLDSAAVGGIVMGAFLAFYAFLGFEDMVNLAEEAENPQRSMPVAIIAALVVATLFYALTVWAALAFLTPVELDASGAPLADVYQAATGRSPVMLTIVAMFAVINGALVQMIMVSRLLYGMGRRWRSLGVFSVVSERTRTPVAATLFVAAVVLVLAAGFPVRDLAEYTSGLVLVVFVLVNASLIKVKRTRPLEPGIRAVPGWVPVSGIVTTISLLGYVCWNELFIE